MLGQVVIRAGEVRRGLLVVSLTYHVSLQGELRVLGLQTVIPYLVS